MGFLMEHPQDPQRYREPTPTPEVQQCPSVWRTAMWKAFKRLLGISEVHFDQGALGHKTVKPTTLGTGLDELLSLDGLRANLDQLTGATEVPSHLLAEWAPRPHSSNPASLTRLPHNINLCHPPLRVMSAVR